MTGGTMTQSESNALVPKRRFPEFRNNSGWRTKFGCELFDQANNRTASAGLPLLAITQEHGAIPRDMIDYQVSVTAESIQTYKEVLPGDFIISLRSFQGGIEYSQYHGICSPAYVVLRKRTKLCDSFYKHLFKSNGFIQQLTRNLEGIRDGKMISYKQFSELRIPYPSLAEQQKIAECLSTLDELIQAESRKLDALKAHKKGLMQRLFPREGETVPQLRFPEFRKAPGWNVCALSTLISSLDAGVSVNGGDRPASKSELGVLKTSAVTNGFFEPNENKVVLEATEQARLAEPVQADTIIISRMNTPALVGASAYVHKSIPNLFLPDRLWAAKPRENVSMRFLSFVLGSDWGRTALAALATGTSGSMKNISKQDVLNLPVKVPTFHEQVRIAACLSSLDDLITEQIDKLAALRAHKRGLLQQLFPSRSEIEP